MRIEAVAFAPATGRAQAALGALVRAARLAGHHVVETTRHAGLAPWMLFWGPGAPERLEAMRRHVAGGGRAVALDLAYWSRQDKVRVSFDAPHPQAHVMARNLPAWRLAGDSPPTGERWSRTGPVIVAGIGRKALVQYGPQVRAWEIAQTETALALGRHVVGRPKPTGPAEPIDDALTGASAVITWHSNVAVDAVRLGVPAVCRDGAAAAVCPSSIMDAAGPLDRSVRDRFLQNLAWFQWNPATEGAAFWRFVEGMA